MAGWVGFDKDMGATRTLAADSAGDAMEATAAGMEEIELRTKDPLRMYRVWRKVGARVDVAPQHVADRSVNAGQSVHYTVVSKSASADFLSADAKSRGSRHALLRGLCLAPALTVRVATQTPDKP